MAGASGCASLKTAPRGYAKDHARIELLQMKGITMSKAWPVGGWLGTKKAKDRVLATLDAARPLNAWLTDHVTGVPARRSDARPG